MSENKNQTQSGEKNIQTGDNSPVEIKNQTYNYFSVSDEIRDWGIITDIFGFIISNKLKPEESRSLRSSRDFTSLINKIDLNFPVSSQKSRFSQSFLNLYGHIHLVQKFISNELEEDGNRVNALIDSIQSEYCKIKQKDSHNEPIEDWLIIENLTSYYLKDDKKQIPEYFSYTKALILFFFELCQFGKLTQDEIKKQNNEEFKFE